MIGSSPVPAPDRPTPLSLRRRAIREIGLSAGVTCCRCHASYGCKRMRTIRNGREDPTPALRSKRHSPGDDSYRDQMNGDGTLKRRLTDSDISLSMESRLYPD